LTGPIDSITSRTGVVASVVVLVGLLVAVQTLVRPWVIDRRERRSAVAGLEVTDVSVGDLSPSSPSRDLRFGLTNSGSSQAVLVDLVLQVTASYPSVIPVRTRTQAEIPRREYRVQLQAGPKNYSIRTRAFGPEPPVLAFAALETEPFLVRLTSSDTECYEFRIVAMWFDASVPSIVHRSESAQLSADYPPQEHVVR
jgi:hypothetical protein